MSSEQTTTTITSPNIQTDPNYVKTPNGIIRIVEAVLCLITFIMAAVLGTGGWVSYIQFATICGFLQALAYFLVNLFMPNIPNYKPHGTLIEFILSAVWFFFLLIAGIVAAAYAPRFSHFILKKTQELIAATAAFSFFSAIAYAVGTFFLFKDWRSSGGSLPTVTSTSTTSTTTTTMKA